MLSENNLKNYQKHNFSFELINVVIKFEEQKKVYSMLNYELIKIIKIIYSYSIKFKKKIKKILKKYYTILKFLLK